MKTTGVALSENKGYLLILHLPKEEDKLVMFQTEDKLFTLHTFI